EAGIKSVEAAWFDKVNDLYLKVTMEILKNPDLLKGTRFEGQRDNFVKNQLENVEEFMAYGMSDRDFQTVLERIPYQGRVSAWDRFVILVRQGMGLARESDTALTALMENFAEITD